MTTQRHIGKTEVTRRARLAEDELRSLLRQAQQGRPGALDALLRKLRPWLLKLFGRRVERDAAEDLTQAALIRVWKALPRIEADRAVEYVVTIALNLLRTARGHVARDKRRRAAVEADYPAMPPVRPDREAEYRDLARLVHDVSLATLSPELHEVILGLLRGLRPSDIAAEQHVNPVTVRTRVRRARGRLRPQVRDHLVREETQPEWVYNTDPIPHQGQAGGSEPSEPVVETVEAQPRVSVRVEAETGPFRIEIWATGDGRLEWSIRLTTRFTEPVSDPLEPSRFSRARTLFPNPK